MALINGSHQPRDIGSLARRMSWIAALAALLLAGYLVLRGVQAERAPTMATAASSPLPASVAAVATGNVAPGSPTRQENAVDAAVAAHEALDPIGVGRNPAP